MWRVMHITERREVTMWRHTGKVVPALALSLGSASSIGRCTVPVMMTGAVDQHRPMETPQCLGAPLNTD
jgi:hypothetical protein